MVNCNLCSEEVKLRYYERHQQEECTHRNVFCPNDDCSYGKYPLRKTAMTTQEEILPRLSAHLLSHHLKYDCDSFAIKNRCILIERGRGRTQYPRPWGIAVSEDE
jgi:hypothetical protein